jgi:hypothetical protein
MRAREALTMQQLIDEITTAISSSTPKRIRASSNQGHHYKKGRGGAREHAAETIRTTTNKEGYIGTKEIV